MGYALKSRGFHVSAPRGGDGPGGPVYNERA